MYNMFLEQVLIGGKLQSISFCLVGFALFLPQQYYNTKILTNYTN